MASEQINPRTGAGTEPEKKLIYTTPRDMVDFHLNHIDYYHPEVDAVHASLAQVFATLALTEQVARLADAAESLDGKS